MSKILAPTSGTHPKVPSARPRRHQKGKGSRSSLAGGPCMTDTIDKSSDTFHNCCPKTPIKNAIRHDAHIGGPSSRQGSSTGGPSMNMSGKLSSSGCQLSPSGSSKPARRLNCTRPTCRRGAPGWRRMPMGKHEVIMHTNIIPSVANCLCGFRLLFETRLCGNHVLSILVSNPVGG